MERNFDFFMVAHAGLQGTSRPAHYAVVYDDNKLGANELQTLVHSSPSFFDILLPANQQHNRPTTSATSSAEQRDPSPSFPQHTTPTFSASVDDATSTMRSTRPEPTIRRSTSQRHRGRLGFTIT